MKNLKKLLAVIITVAIMATMMVPVFAAEEISEDANIVAELELLLGDGDEGVTSEYLAKDTVRIQAAIILLRLLGKLDEALAFDDEENFADADQVWAEGQNVLAYLKANPELGWVGDGENFKPLDQATSQEIYKVMLEVLGYKAGAEGDFTWEETLDFAADNGLELIADVDSMTNDDLAIAIVEALKATNADGVVLVDKLIEDGLIDEDQAIELGLVSGELVIDSASATGASLLKVTFNKAVDTTKAVFSVKNGSFIVPVTATWNEAKTEATLTKTFGKYAAGDYTVTISGLELATGKDTVTLAVAAEAIASIEFVGTNLVKVAPVGATPSTTATIGYKVNNQYGEDITSTASISGVSSYGTVAAVAGVATVTKATAWASTDPTTGSVTLYNGTKTSTATVTLADAIDVSAITLGSMILPADTTRLIPSSTVTTVNVSFEAVDQYGNATKLPVGALTDITPVYAGGITGATVIADPNDASKQVIQVNVPVVTAKTTATLTLLVNKNGKSSTVTFDLYPAATVADYTLTPDTAIIKPTVAYKVWIDAVDTYGAAVDASTLAGYDGQFSIVSLIPSIADIQADQIKFDSVKKKSYIDVMPATVGSTNMVITLKATGKSVTLPITVNQASEVVGMTLSANAFNFATNGTSTLKATFKDQYNDAVATLPGYTVTFATSDATIIDAPASTDIAGLVAGVTLAPDAGITNKSATVTVTLTKTAGSVVVDVQTVAIKVIDSAATTLTYQIADVATLHGLSAAEITAGTIIADYDAALTLTAKDSAGNIVYVPKSVIKSVTSTNPALVTVVNTAGDYTVYGAAAGIASGTEASATLTVVVENYDGTVSIATKTVTVSNAPLAAASLKAYLADDTEVTGDVSATSFKFVALDQYGVAMAIPTIIATNVPAGVTVDTTTTPGTVSYTGALTTSFNVTAITANGILKTVKVVAP